MLKFILDWSEVWALVLPLAGFYFRPNQPGYFKPVMVYCWVALLINLSSDIIGDFKMYLPEWLQTNLVLYSFHSLFRFVCFYWFFELIRQVYFTLIRRITLVVFLVFILLNYLIFEDYLDQNHLSGNLFTLEMYFLLINCMLYYLSQLRDDVLKFRQDQGFWIITGLSIYVVINFFIFLFYLPMLKENPMLAERMWGVHNIAYIVLCIFITKALYVPRPLP